jgi:nucleoside-diphosphate kinase
MMLQTNAPLRTRTPFSAARRCARPSARVARAVNVRAEISYIMIKPDGVQRGLVGDIISRFEKKGFLLKGLKLYQTPREVAEEHYKDLKEKPFYPALVGYIVSGPVVAMVCWLHRHCTSLCHSDPMAWALQVWEGKGVIASARKMIGATNPLAAEPGTIRGDFAVEVGRNVVHGSDSIENGEREAGIPGCVSV